MLIHGSELVAVAQGLVEYWDYRWTFSALRQNLKTPSTTVHAESPCEDGLTVVPRAWPRASGTGRHANVSNVSIAPHAHMRHGHDPRFYLITL